MNHICPYCNGLKALEIQCPSCGTTLDDCGTLQEALGPYAPYEESALKHAHFDCVHQTYCQKCGIEYIYTLPG
ncbi:MAG: hypothetical protein KGZ54_00385 [Dethiobacter sp.]|jgi:hypothetical protein|nr:hypothetical protein [Dethiobacter sp.]MBS3989780.1 hypothetical protein [Dethiobacter sp.]